MEAQKYIWIDGELRPWAEATVHALTHTFHYGGGAFEGIRFYDTAKGPAIFRLGEHVDRLLYSAGVLSMQSPWSRDEIMAGIVLTVRENGLAQGYIRPMFFYDDAKMGLNPSGNAVRLLIACWPWGKYLSDGPVKVGTSSFMRIHPSTTVVDAKLNGHYANSILAGLDAKKRGYDEALFLDYEGNVAEGPGENIFLVKNNSLYTPQKGSILAGITRASVMQIAKDLGYAVTETKLTPHDLTEADELFFTGTAAEVTIIGSLDDKPVGNGTIGPVSERIKTTYLDAVRGKVDAYTSWLTFVN